MINNFKYWIYGITLTYSFLFFSIYSILGIEFQGSASSPIYIFGALFLSLISITFCTVSLWKPKRISLVGLFFLLLPIFISIIYFVEYPDSKFAFQIYSTFLVIVFPTIMIGLDIAKSQSIARLNNVLFFCFWVVLIAMLRLLPMLISIRLNELATIFGGGGTQQMSYTISFAYMIGLLLLTSKNSIIQKPILKFGLYICLISLIFFAILGGGRGAFLVIIFSSIFFLYKYISGKTVLIIIIALIPIYVLFNYFTSELDVRFLESYTRIFAYIGDSGIDTDGLSHRDLFYAKAVDLFKDRVLFGYGIFLFTDAAGGEFYSHNIFLDLLLQGGIFLLIGYFVILYMFFKRLKKIIVYDISNNTIIIFIIYSFILLLFTSTYLMESFFWFSFSYVFGFPLYNRSKLSS